MEMNNNLKVNCYNKTNLKKNICIIYHKISLNSMLFI